MKIYLIMQDCVDPYFGFGPEFEGHAFSTKEKADKYNETIRESYRIEPLEVELDSIKEINS